MDWRKQPRPGKGPTTRGGVTAKRKLAMERRDRVSREGSPWERIDGRCPFQGSIDFLERFYCHVFEMGPNDCWPWTGQVDRRRGQGYGMATLNNTGHRAHRIAWELANGTELPTEIFGCHTCDTPICCNPRHVFPGTVTDNNRDAANKGHHANASKTHCKRGHEFTPDNVEPTGKGGRRCRTCAKRLAMKNYYLRTGQPEKAEAWL